MQIITAIVTLVGVLCDDADDKPLLTLISLITLPLTALATWLVAGRSKGIS